MLSFDLFVVYAFVVNQSLRVVKLSWRLVKTRQSASTKIETPSFYNGKCGKTQRKKVMILTSAIACDIIEINLEETVSREVL